MHGNRDFLISDKFCKKYGMELIDDPTVIELSGKKILLMHGDTLCTDDIKYQNYRKLVRSKEWQVEMLKKTLEERLSIAEELRKIGYKINFSDKYLNLFWMVGNLDLI